MTRPLASLLLLVVVAALSCPLGTLAGPHPEGPSEPGHHEHHPPAPGAEVHVHDDNPEDLGNHLPIQVYYHREHVNQPWRTEQRRKTYRGMMQQGAVLFLLQGGLVGWMWRRRNR